MSLVTALGHGGGPAAPVPERRAGRGAYALLAPGMLYLGLFFVVPVFALLLTSLYVPVPGGDVGQFQPAFEWRNYVDAVAQYWPQMVRSFLYALTATVARFARTNEVLETVTMRVRALLL